MLAGHRAASMGPPSFESGKSLDWRSSTARGCCFNGTALIRERKAADLHHAAVFVRDDASMGPPSFESGKRIANTVVETLRRLQWGRPHSRAERPLRPRAGMAYPRLQWGRPHSRAEREPPDA